MIFGVSMFSFCARRLPKYDWCPFSSPGQTWHGDAEGVAINSNGSPSKIQTNKRGDFSWNISLTASGVGDTSHSHVDSPHLWCFQPCGPQAEPLYERHEVTGGVHVGGLPAMSRMAGSRSAMKRTSVLLVGLVAAFAAYSFLSSSTKMENKLRSELRARVNSMRIGSAAEHAKHDRDRSVVHHVCAYIRIVSIQVALCYFVRSYSLCFHNIPPFHSTTCFMNQTRH